MKNLARNNAPAMLIYFLTALVALIIILNFEKNNVHLFVNQYVGNRYLNAFFFNATYLGDGMLAPFLVLAITVVNMRAGVAATCALLLATLISSTLKFQFFDDADRPFYIFKYFDRRELNLVKGVHMYIHNSFPSGHSTQAFAIFMSASLVARRQFFKVFFVSVAILVAFSRVYLSQHWLVDILAGSLIGTACSAIFYYAFVSRDKLKTINRPLSALFKRKP